MTYCTTRKPKSLVPSLSPWWTKPHKVQLRNFPRHFTVVVVEKTTTTTTAILLRSLLLLLLSSRTCYQRREERERKPKENLKPRDTQHVVRLSRNNKRREKDGVSNPTRGRSNRLLSSSSFSFGGIFYHRSKNSIQSLLSLFNILKRMKGMNKVGRHLLVLSVVRISSDSNVPPSALPI